MLSVCQGLWPSKLIDQISQREFINYLSILYQKITVKLGSVSLAVFLWVGELPIKNHQNIEIFVFEFYG